MPYRVRFLVGDFNLALFLVIPEMRARNMLINLVAWQPWQVKGEPLEGSYVRCDTCGIFAIGGCASIKLPFDCSVLGVRPAPARGDGFQPSRKSVKNDQGKYTQETVPL